MRLVDWLKEKFGLSQTGSIFLILLVLSITSGAIGGYILAHYTNVERITALENYRPSVITIIYDSKDNPISQFALEKRIVIPFSEIPKNFINAVIAAEDDSFYHHIGIDPVSILRAIYKDIIHLRKVQGASTITQQLARNLFLTPKKTFTRKIKEALYAIQIENHYTKRKILELYCNQVYLGYNRFGIEAAARYYFGKKAKDLTLAECAAIAGLIKAPAIYSPFRYPSRAVKRRNMVLDLMVKEGFITKAQADKAKKEPLILRKRGAEGSVAPYFVEEVRKFLEKRFGRKATYRGGLRVYTTLDSKLQRIANKAVEDGVRALDKREGFRGGYRNIIKEGLSPKEFWLKEWNRPLVKGRIVRGLILSVKANKALVKIGRDEFPIGRYEVVWTHHSDLRKLFKPGDLVPFRIEDVSAKGKIRLSLEQDPLVNGALVAIEVGTGRIRAMVGGIDFEKSKFNRATQGKRQTGSAFKPFVYAAALDSGLTASTTVFDEPATFYDPYTNEPYEPSNYHNRYFGVVTLREALEKSLNVATIKIELKVGVDKVVKYAKRCGITENIQPFLSIGLGSFEVTPLEMTAAYSVFPNQGVWVEPYFIEKITDTEGNILYTHTPKTKQALSADTAFLTHKLLEGVVLRGTAAAAASLGLPLAGKTGTTNDYTDAWFIGYSPNLVCGVWVGFDEKKTLGPNESGARAALPIWMEFMKNALVGKPIGNFSIPPGIVFRRIDRRTGLLATPLCPPQDIILEAYREGTEPVKFCGEEYHRNLKLPYYLQEKLVDIY